MNSARTLRPTSFRLVAVTAVTVFSVSCGCQQWPHTWKNPFAADPPAYKAAYGPTPRQKMQSIRALATRASSMSDEEQRRSVQQISELLDREADPLLRREAVHALAAFEIPEAAACLQRAIHDPSPDVRVAACRVCGGHAASDTLTRLLHDRLTHDESHEVRCAAVAALASTRTHASLQLAAEALRDPDPALQVVAMNALQKATGQELGRDINAWLAYVQDLARQEDQTTPRDAEVQLATAIGQ